MMNMIKEIVVISGKGGTGKTSITASLAWFARNEAVVVDCDVDAANLHLLLSPKKKKEQKFYSGFEVEVDHQSCLLCGKCQEVCRFGAIEIKNGVCQIDSLACEGCGYCEKVCPTAALSLKQAHTGWIFHSNTRLGMSFIDSKLKIGAENSGKMVTQLKQDARKIIGREGKKLLLVDGTPGIGCPVIASLSGADLVVLVTEPTLSGLHDLKRAYQLVKSFGIPAVCIINKATLNPQIDQETRDYLKINEIELVGELPYHKKFITAMVNGVTLPEFDLTLRDQLEMIWKRIHQHSLFL